MTLEQSTNKFNTAFKELIIIIAKSLKIDLYANWLSNKLKR